MPAEALTQESIARALDVWRKDPIPFIRDVLRADPWGKDLAGEETGQILIARSTAGHTETSVVSCNSIGKDYIAAQLTLWWLAIWEEAAVVTLAPTAHQVKDLTWRDIHKAYGKSAIPFGGDLNQTALQIGERRFATGLATDKKERVMGIHNSHLLIIVTEASGMPEEVMEGVDTLGSGGDAHILLLGNPTADKGTFYRSHHDLADQYKTIHVGYLDTPNFEQGPQHRTKVVRPYLITPEWVEKQRRKWGEGSPLWDIHIEGNFPKQAADALIPFNVALAAQQRWHSVMTDEEKRHPLIVGVDVARNGDSETVVSRRRGTWVAPLEVYEGEMMTTEVRDVCLRIIKEENPNRLYIDATGIGGAVCDELDDLGIHMHEPVYTGASATDPTRFENMRAEMWWKARMWLAREGGTLPLDDLIINQITGPRYGYSRRERVKVESKDDMRRRGFKSPDRADAVILTLVDELENEAGSGFAPGVKGSIIG